MNRVTMVAALVAVAAWILPGGSAWAGPMFGLGETAHYGTVFPDGANFRNWNGLAPQTMDPQGTGSNITKVSQRFTANGSTGVDGLAPGRMLGWDSANDTVTLGIQADDGSGNPSGTYLAKYVGTPYNQRGAYPLDATINLAADTVYHVVVDSEGVAPTTTGPKVYFQRMNDSTDTYNRVMPYNLKDDANNAVLTYSAGSWSAIPGREMASVFFAGSTAVNEGQPFTNSQPYTQLRGSVQRVGQTFAISDQVIAAGQAIEVDSIWLSTYETGTTKDCLVTLRDMADFDTVLATATITPATAVDAVAEYALDTTIQLEQGVQYVFMADFATPGATTDEQYRFENYVADYIWAAGGDVDCGPATFGGSESRVVKQTWNGGTSSWNPLTDDSVERDLWFRFEGEVVPEPMTLSLLALGALAVLRRTW